MKPYVTIIDDFLPDPDKVRAEVIKAGFSDFEFQGKIYQTVNITDGMEDIKPAFDSIFGEVRMHLSAWRQGKQGSPLHSKVHADNSCAAMASVLYMNKPEDCSGGTAFWRHKETAWESMPTAEQLEEMGYTLEAYGDEWNKIQAWEQVMVAPMAYNRIVIYPTTLIHSRWPLEGFGDDEENARMIGAFFFDVL